MCAVERVVNPIENITIIERVIPIAGNFELSLGPALDPKWTRLKTSSRPADRGREGVELEIGGGRYPQDSKNGEKQKAVVEFLCDKKPEERRGNLRRDGQEEGDGEGNEKDSADDGEGGTLSFSSYEMVGDERVLGLTWQTKYACEDAQEDSGRSGGGHWGFFTWFIIMWVYVFTHVSACCCCKCIEYLCMLTDYSIFLGVAAYLIFGSWLNYNRYSARGWDLVPHSETIRDLPYLLRDWMRRVVSTVQGGGSRGGYSAV